MYNFAAGPATFPKSVLEAAKEGLLDWEGSGQSVMEIPFTGDEYKQIYDDAVASLRMLLDIPSDYQILLMQGGAYGQFSILPMNMLRGYHSADYAVTGHWSRRAAEEAKKYGSINIVVDTSDNDFTNIPNSSDWSLDPQAAYCHITTNETANGNQYKELPNTGSVPLVADVTSDFLMAPIEVKRFGVLYASAQKNAGTSGLTVVIVKQQVLGQAMSITPSVFDYQRLASNASKVNTPPVWSIYIAGLMFKWITAEGGLEEMARCNQRKSTLLYETIDSSDFYVCPVEQAVRSTVNVCFSLPTAELEKLFIHQASESGLYHLHGHSVSGGIRASLYNAVTEDAVTALVKFMQDFAGRHV